jgi:hypothetical protein
MGIEEKRMKRNYNLYSPGIITAISATPVSIYLAILNEV